MNRKHLERLISEEETKIGKFIHKYELPRHSITFAIMLALVDENPSVKWDKKFAKKIERKLRILDLI